MNIQERVIRAIQSLQVSILKNSGYRYQYIDTKKTAPHVDLENKVLYVPVFGAVEDKDNDLIRFFNIHELAHCKYTVGNMEPDWTVLKKDLVNSLEDLRIERAISRDELGLNKIVKDGQLECYKRYSEAIVQEKNPIGYAVGKCQFMSMGYEVIGNNKDGEKIYERIFDLYDSWKKLPNTYGNGVKEIVKLADEIIKLIEKMKEEHKAEKTPEQKEQERKEKEEKKKKKEEEKKKKEEQKKKGEEKGKGKKSEEGEEGEGDEQDGEEGKAGKKESEKGKPKKSKKGEKKAGKEDEDGEEEGEGKPADDDSMNWDDEEAEGEEEKEDGEEKGKGKKGEKSEEGEEGEGGEGEEGEGDEGEEGEGSHGKGESDEDGEGSEGSDGDEVDGEAVKQAMREYETGKGSSTAERLIQEISKISQETVSEADYLAYKDEDIYNTEIYKDDNKYTASYGEITSVVRKIQMVLEQALKSRAQVKRMSHQHQGKLDTKRLHVISKNLSKNIFYKVQEGESMNTCVQLVVDESGSMRGSKSDVARAVAIAFAECLSKMKIPFEILGFTTVGWSSKTIPPFHRTLPVRLDVFKGYSEQYEAVKTRLGSMEGQNHNVDGDSVRMCWDRAKVRRERRKVMLVMSDGMPEEDRAGSSRLYPDLKKAVKEVRDEGGEVYGFGIQTQEPERFYGKESFLYVGDVDKLGNDFFRRLAEIIIK